jgi:thioredoxin 2
VTSEPATVIACPHCATKNRVRPVGSGVPRCSACHKLLPWIVEATADSFEAEIASSVPVLVDFWAPWCGPCRMVSPAVERVGSEQAGRLKVVKLNVDEAPAIARRFAVQGIPLLVLLRDAAEADRLVGAVPVEHLRRWLEANLEPAPGVA